MIRMDFLVLEHSSTHAEKGSVFFFFLLYHAFIVFRYKKLHAALAMEKTKPINQKNSNKGNHSFVPPRTESFSKPIAELFNKTKHNMDNKQIIQNQITRQITT